MTAQLRRIAGKLIKLSPEERLEIADRLYASIETPADTDFEKAWAAEIDRRLDEYEKGKAVLVPSKEVHARLRKIIHEARRTHIGRSARSRRGDKLVRKS